MSKASQVLIVLMVGAISIAATGCKKEQPAPKAADAKKAVQQTAPAVPTDPAAQKPKDHPAH